MSTTIWLPPTPREVPPLQVEVAAIRTFAADLLAGAAQVDDLGTFVAADARIGDWSALAATSYRETIAPLGHRADAMSLALRSVSRRCDAHAEAMAALVERRTTLLGERAHLVGAVEALAARAHAATDTEAAVIQAECDDCRRQVEAFEHDLSAWSADLTAEETAMREAFDRVLRLDQVERRYAGVADPADAALDTLPGPGAGPTEVNAWWDGLSHQQQQAVIAASPGSIGNRDGVPPWARDQANHLALDRDLADWEYLEQRDLLTSDEERWLENARSARDAVETIEAGLDPVTREGVTSQLYAYDPTAFEGDGAVAVAAGNLDTADNVAVVVPGFGTDGESAPYQAARALTLYESSRFLGATETNASMFWIGYDAPDNMPWDEGWDAAGVVTEDMATRGGERLADTLDGLRSARDGEPAHLTAIGHSYGSTTTGHAAHDQGIPVDDLVLVGSPGAGGGTDTAGDTGVATDHVWAGANSRDPIANLGNHGWVHGETAFGAGLGDDPAEDDFGAHRFRAESTTRADDAIGLDAFDDHSKYFDHDTEALYNISQIVNGNYDAVEHADHVYDPFYAGVRDPELDRDPTAPDTDGRRP
ncbi:alpha/beta hydrolase [Nocardioides sp.]|uniref:alpha/beta hydrolase n=1 Tax=Nocardioides sp. TaxID=35761 RepID=UPI002D8092CF|nr:alpha/beta hydrolase [Nocardioides sp.]HET8960516.1 alpha/beta hydrolase [Nocardioides sp.]